jgi:hypothetical protein
MGAIIIRSGQENTKMLHELAKMLGADVMKLKDEEFEELKLGRLMDKTKTGKLVSRKTVFKKLTGK